MAGWNGNWQLKSIEAVTKRVKVGYVGTCQKDYCSKNEGVPMIRTTNLGTNGIDYSDLKYVTKEFHEKNKKSQLHKNDILIARHGENGRACIVENEIEANCLNVVVIEPDESIVLSDFLKYLFDYSEIKFQIQGATVGSVQSVVNTKTIAQLKIPVPSICEQERIVSILRNYDDKISVNTRINRNLQDQAFVMFEQLVMEHDPEDVCNLSEISDINPKRILSKNVEARCIDMTKLSTSGAFPDGWEYKSFTGGMKFQNGDTLLARITPCLENGKTAYINFLNDDEVAFGSTEYVVLAVKGNTPPEMLYCLARYSKFIDYAVKNMNGSSGRQRVSGEIVGQYQVPNFNNNEMDRFRKVSELFFEMMKQNSLENMRLVELRDALLPRLMSGELDVSDLQL